VRLHQSTHDQTGTRWVCRCGGSRPQGSKPCLSPCAPAWPPACTKLHWEKVHDVSAVNSCRLQQNTPPPAAWPAFIRLGFLVVEAHEPAASAPVIQSICMPPPAAPAIPQHNRPHTQLLEGATPSIADQPGRGGGCRQATPACPVPCKPPCTLFPARQWHSWQSGTVHGAAIHTPATRPPRRGAICPAPSTQGSTSNTWNHTLRGTPCWSADCHAC
jgi:hypothetical protein